MSLDAIPTTDLFDTFTKTLCVGYDNVTLTRHSLVGRLGIMVAPIINLTGRLVESFLHLVQSPFGIVAFGESFPEVLLFFLKQLGITAHGGSPVGEGLDDTKLGREVMVAVPLYILVCMCGFPVYRYGQRTISLRFNNSVQEGDGPILLVVLYCKPYGRVNTVYVLKEALFVGFLVDDKGVIHIPAPEPGGWGQYLELFVLSTPCIS